MNIQGRLGPLIKGKHIASIDLGSHTARFLVSKIFEAPILFRPVARKRFYTNLAEGFNQEDTGVITPDSFKRAINAVEDFKKTAEEYSVVKIAGAATGVFRRAKNGQVLLNEIKERTGIDIAIVAGEEEAAITLKGIFHSLGLSDYPDAFFDLGGSTTEFIYKSGNTRKIISLPVGAFVLSDMFFKNDPPLDEEIIRLKHYVNGILDKNIGNIKSSRDFILIGSGGTVTSLAAIIMKLDKREVTSDIINGSLLAQDKIFEFYESIKMLPLSDRLKIKSIDEGRAKVILAGTLAVLSILGFFKTSNLKVSYSDILEGLIISNLEGGKDE